MKRNKNYKTGTLIIALIVVLLGGVLFIGAVSGWFGETKITLDAEYYTDAPELIDIDGAEYNNLIANKKSFMLFVDQDGCTTADRLKEYAESYNTAKGISAYRIMFSEIKDLSLHDYVKFYPSLVLVSKGRVATFLRADSDEDAEIYNNYDAFKTWLDKYL